MSPKEPRPSKKRNILTEVRPVWKEDVYDHDYVAAFQFLSLVMSIDMALQLEGRFRDQDTIIHRKAKDLLRAAEVPLLPATDEYVTGDLLKITNGKALSPVLYVQGNDKRKPIIADGYHRICASYHCDPDADVKLKMV